MISLRSAGGMGTAGRLNDCDGSGSPTPSTATKSLDVSYCSRRQFCWKAYPEARPAHCDARANRSDPRDIVNPGFQAVNRVSNLHAPDVRRAWVGRWLIMGAQRRLTMTITPELILALATLVTAVSSLVWTLRRRR